MNEKLRELKVSLLFLLKSGAKLNGIKLDKDQCSISATMLEDLIKEYDTPKHETVQQWEERTGDIYPDDGPVWMEIYNCNGLNGGLTLHLVTWNIARQSEPLITPRIIVATHHGKPSC